MDLFRDRAQLAMRARGWVMLPGGDWRITTETGTVTLTAAEAERRHERLSAAEGPERLAGD